MCLSRAHFPFFGNLPLDYPFRKCRPPCSGHGLDRKSPLSCHVFPLLGVETVPSPLSSPAPSGKVMKDRVPRPMRGVFRNFVVMLRKSRPVPWYCWEQEGNEWGSAGEDQGRDVVRKQPAQKGARTRRGKQAPATYWSPGIQPSLKPGLPGPLNPIQTLVLYCCVTNHLKT